MAYSLTIVTKPGVKYDGSQFYELPLCFVIEYLFIPFWLNCYEQLLRTFALPNKLLYGGFQNHIEKWSSGFSSTVS